MANSGEPGDSVFRAAFAAAPVPMVLVVDDDDEATLAVNDAAGRLLQRAPETATGMSLEKLFETSNGAVARVSERIALSYGVALLLLSAAAIRSEGSTSHRVLVVDDEPAIREAVRAALQQAGHEVRLANDAESARELFETDTAGFDVLVTDVVLPAMRGNELALALREMNPQLPVLVISGYGSRASDPSLVGSGPTVELQKPFLVADLLGALRALTDS